MTDTMTSQSIDLLIWDTLYIIKSFLPKEPRECWNFVGVLTITDLLLLCVTWSSYIRCYEDVN
jgi:hypothetical protein